MSSDAECQNRHEPVPMEIIRHETARPGWWITTYRCPRCGDIYDSEHRE